MAWLIAVMIMLPVGFLWQPVSLTGPSIAGTVQHDRDESA